MDEGPGVKHWVMSQTEPAGRWPLPCSGMYEHMSSTHLSHVTCFEPFRAQVIVATAVVQQRGVWQLAARAHGAACPWDARRARLILFPAAACTRTRMHGCCLVQMQPRLQPGSKGLG